MLHGDELVNHLQNVLGIEALPEAWYMPRLYLLGNRSFEIGVVCRMG